jgi:hypothetical protein
MERETPNSNVTGHESPFAEKVRQFRQAPSAEEIALRQAAWAEFLKVRDAVGPVDVDPTELLRRARQEEDASLNG